MILNIKSQFQFLSCRMNSVLIKPVSDKEVQAALLLDNSTSSVSETDFKIRFKNPSKFRTADRFFFAHNLEASVTVRKGGKEIAHGIFDFTALFETCEFHDKEAERKVITVQTPSIIFPRLKSQISSVLSAAGYGTVIMPLMNFSGHVSSEDMTITDVGIIDNN